MRANDIVCQYTIMHTANTMVATHAQLSTMYQKTQSNATLRDERMFDYFKQMIDMVLAGPRCATFPDELKDELKDLGSKIGHFRMQSNANEAFAGRRESVNTTNLQTPIPVKTKIENFDEELGDESDSDIPVLDKEEEDEPHPQSESQEIPPSLLTKLEQRYPGCERAKAILVKIIKENPDAGGIHWLRKLKEVYHL